MALVRAETEALSQDTANPAVSNGPIVLRAISLDKAGRYVRDADDRPLAMYRNSARRLSSATTLRIEPRFELPVRETCIKLDIKPPMKAI
jgi:hypothetical protein